MISSRQHNIKEDIGMENEKIKEIILDTTIASLEAQLRAVKRLRGEDEKKEARIKGKSQVEYVYDILKIAGKELHVLEIIERAEKAYGVHLDRESIVSALTKKIKKEDRFERVGKNIFRLRREKR